MSSDVLLAQQGKDFTLPTIGAVFIHVIAAALLFGSWQFSVHKPVEFQVPAHIQAELITVAPPTPEPVVQPKPKPTPKPVVQSKPKPAPTPKPVVTEKVAPKPEVAPVATTEPKPVQKPVEEKVPEPVVEEKPVEVPETPVEVVDFELPDEESLFEALAAEEARFDEQRATLEQNRMRNAEVQTAIEAYKNGITTQISQKWSRPIDQLTDLSHLKATASVELLPTGELLNVTLTGSSGNALYDQSVIRAIEKVIRYDVPDDPEVFEKGGFRRLNVTFTPEDLMGQ